MWIMLTSKLPTEISPPKLSIFWSVPWKHDEYSKNQKKICQWCGSEMWEEDSDEKKSKKKQYCSCGNAMELEEDFQFSVSKGMIYKEPNWYGARKIHYKGSDIRIFPHEFSAIKRENMILYVLGYEDIEPSHVLVPDSVASESISDKILYGDDRLIYDAALVDGATNSQAMAVAQGIDITSDDFDFPPIGWYRCRQEYARIYCDEWEMKE